MQNPHKRTSGAVCSASGCNMRTGTNLLSQVKMYRFPKNEERRKQWEAATNRANWKASQFSVLCNKHFITGKPSKDPLHPDYIPTIFAHARKSDTSKKMERYERLVKRGRIDRKPVFKVARPLTNSSSSIFTNQKKSLAVQKIKQYAGFNKRQAISQHSSLIEQKRLGIHDKSGDEIKMKDANEMTELCMADIDKLEELNEALQSQSTMIVDKGQKTTLYELREGVTVKKFMSLLKKKSRKTYSN